MQKISVFLKSYQWCSPEEGPSRPSLAPPHFAFGDQNHVIDEDSRPTSVRKRLTSNPLDESSPYTVFAGSTLRSPRGILKASPTGTRSTGSGSISASASASRRVSFSEPTAVEVKKDTAYTMDSPLCLLFPQIDDVSKKVVSMVLFFFLQNSTSKKMNDFILWYFEDHLGVPGDQVELILNSISSGNIQDISLIEEAKSHFVDEQSCIKSAIQILIDQNPTGHVLSLKGIDLSGMDLRDLQFSCRVDLSNANLYRSNLSGLDLMFVTLFNANLSLANLSEADLSGVNMQGALLDGANLRNASLEDTNLRRVRLSTRPNGPICDGARFVMADLTYANFTGASFSETVFRDCRCVASIFNYAKFIEADFSHSNLGAAKFMGAILINSILSSDQEKNSFCEEGKRFMLSKGNVEKLNFKLSQNKRMDLSTFLSKDDILRFIED